eukprot:TRINITY_DN31101_c1_g2_i1.p1 TRINITY_DN31101_c1_g2~~TRINITY_DN31101_c1_g2_i1.p1  ORF type:complete len:246 (+),score=28.53 TRINITY_DN31101_c1_g2_i1:383-1120(+)
MNLTIYGDSELVIKQITGEYRVRDEKLRYFHKIVMTLLEKFYDYQCVHLDRGFNEEADALATSAAAQNRPAPDSDQVVVFRPNLCMCGKARIGDATIPASNDIGADGSSGVFLIDAQFLVETCGIDALENLYDENPFEICWSKQWYNVLGVLRQNLRVRLWSNYSDTDDESFQINAKNFVVIHRLPVPFHFTMHAPETENLDWISKFGERKKFVRDSFGEPYRSHPYWELGDVIVPPWPYTVAQS